MSYAKELLSILISPGMAWNLASIIIPSSIMTGLYGEKWL
jgi:hypothetical protein